MWRTLRPVGEAVPPPGPTWAPPDGVSTRWYASGTAALAGALAAVVAQGRFTGTPEVLMPAYTCPDVVSAIEYAGARAVLVDLEPDRPLLGAAALERACCDRTCAVVAINFQGIPERIEALRTFADAHDLALVYDHCQAFPASADAIAASDYLVFSFGRGKPASALVGGAVWSARHDVDTLPVGPVSASGPSALKRHLYNLVIRPRLYSVLLKVPGLGIGQTVYHPLDSVDGLDASGTAQVHASIEAHARRTGAVERREAYAGMVRSLGESWTALPEVCTLPPDARLLRYPVLAQRAALRDAALARLDALGLGASPLYPATIDRIDGLAGKVDSPGHPQATDFAARLLTLPMHADVRHRDIELIGRVLAASAA